MIRPNIDKSNLRFKDKIFSLDFSLIFMILLLGVISIFAMYSSEQGKFGYYTQSHLYRFSIFFAVFVMFSFFRIQFWFKSAYLFYFVILILLFAVYFYGVTASGSTRWINLFFVNLQPSELMKVALIVFLARYYYKIPTEHVTNIKYIIFPLLALFVPIFLVATQPDLGTAALIMTTGIVVIWLTGFGIKQNIQSKIAVGSGGIFGKGFLQGSQSYLDYLPEKHTDFIFTLFSEEFGFVGSLALLLIYAIIIYRIIVIGIQSKNNFAKLYCFGFATAFFVYVSVNMSMVLGLLPIVGAPLPIMSYGGSSMLSMMIGLSIVMSCKIYEMS